jgi:hypothetical protein
MSGQATVYAAMALIIGALIIVAIFGQRYRLRRAMRQLVAAFRRQGATSPAKGTTLEKLGIVRVNPLEGMLKGRDYRPEALRLLKEANIIRATEAGTLYLSEDELEHSTLKILARIK